MYHFHTVITYSAFLKHLSKNRNKRRQYISYLQISNRPTIQSDILEHSDFGMPMKLDTLINTCCDETSYTEVWECKHLYDAFPIQNSLQQRQTSQLLLATFLLTNPCSMSRRSRTNWN